MLEVTIMGLPCAEPATTREPPSGLYIETPEEGRLAITVVLELAATVTSALMVKIAGVFGLMAVLKLSIVAIPFATDPEPIALRPS